MSYLAHVIHRVDAMLSLWTRTRAESDLVLMAIYSSRGRLRR
jgi:hypothetical protein